MPKVTSAPVRAAWAAVTTAAWKAARFVKCNPDPPQIPVRLRALDTEIATEPDRVREAYRVRASRVEPVGLVYLWPATN